MTDRPGTHATTQAERQRTPYGIFLAVMTVFALITSGILALDWLFTFAAAVPMQIIVLLEWVDMFFVALFLLDWFYSLAVAKGRVEYLFGERPGRSLPYGVLELFGCIPFSFAFRVLRVFRLRRIGWHLPDLTPGALYRAVMASRTESAVLITILISFLVIVGGSIAILFFELDQPITTIDSAEDAFWWAFVTITTVGYGDTVPFTTEGRIVGVLTMLVGIGVFAAIAGSLAGMLTSGRDYRGRVEERRQADAIASELASLREEVVALREALDPERAGPR